MKTDNTRGKSFKCLDCGRSYKHFSSIASHLRKHTRENSLECHICSKEFLYESKLARHIQTVHDKVPVTHECPVCHLKFTNYLDLVKHFRANKSHEITKRFHCKICNKGFSRNCEMQIHLRIHTGERPYQCELCGTSFLSQSQLAKHRKKSHQKVYAKTVEMLPYKCDECEKSFKTVSCLKNHKRSHETRKRIYSCEFCTYKTYRQRNFYQHQLIHTGPAYHCDQCSYKTVRRDNLKNHQLIHSGLKPYRCSFCNAAYTDKSNLNKHIKQQHPET